VLSESAARWMLVLHTALGVAAVGAATHLVIWMRRMIRGQFGLHKAVKKFAIISLVLHALAFIAGNVMYPTYKVEVRAAYLENANAIVEQANTHQRELDRITTREKVDRVELSATSDMVMRAAKAARWFDVKEHWIALGLFASLGLALILRFWNPRTDTPALSPIAFGLSLVIAGTVWLGAIIGVLTASYRAV
jgi:hypothetical protein